MGRYIILTFIIVLLVFSCHSGNKIGGSVENKNLNISSSFRLIVSFYSPGNGIDRKMKTQYDEFLVSNYSNVTSEKIKWGREGEIDYCFKLSELNESNKKKFIKKSKKILAASSRVRVYENAECKHKNI